MPPKPAHAVPNSVRETRTRPLSRLLLAVLALLCFGSAAVAAADAKRPNILFAFADDWGRHAGAYARIDGPGTVNDAIRTPNFDRLAREGVLFRRAFVPAPSCTPCRSALLSGQHFWRTGRASILRGAVWDGSNISFPLLLRDAGYHIGETHKVWSPGTPVDAPFDAPKHSYEQAGRRFNQFSQNVTRMVAAGEPLEAAKQKLYDEVAANFDAFLADRKPGQPFFYWFGPTEVHRQWVQGSGKALWGIDPDTLKGKLPPFLPDVPEVREDLADYFGEIQSFDAALGVLMEKLKAIGELENTVIVVSGDHGAPGFPHGKCNLYDFGSGVALAIRWGGARGGRVVDDLVSLCDLAPTFLELAGIKPPESMTGKSLANILISSAGGRVDPSRTAVFIGRERHVENARAGFLPYPQRAIRTPDYLYIINFKPERWPMGDPFRLDGDNPPTPEELRENTRVTLADADAGPTKAWLVSQRNDPQWKWHYDLAYGRRPREELFDLRSDPHQINNVAANPAYAEVRAELEQRLMEELRRTGDPRVVEDGRFFETLPMAGPLAANTSEAPAPAPRTQSPQSAPAVGSGSDLLVREIAFGSCINTNAHPMLDKTLEERFDLFILLGDNIYADTTNMTVMRNKYEALKRSPFWRQLRQKAPVLATWDDHDYGANDAGAEYIMKRESQQLFLDFLDIPQDSPKRTREGVYDAHLFGPPGRRLQVILLDTRYFRSTLSTGINNVVPSGGRYVPKDDPEATVLGEAQWSWLEQQLRIPAELRIIGSSIQFLSEFSGAEAWANLPREKKRMLDLLKTTRANGVFFISGDRHWAELSRMDREGDYPLYDFTSSALTQKHGRGTPTPNIYRDGPTYHDANLGRISIDWREHAAFVTLRLIDANGGTRIEKTIEFHL